MESRKQPGNEIRKKIKIRTSTEGNICEGKCRQIQIFDETSQNIWMQNPND